MPAIGVDILGNPTSLLRAFKESEVAAAEFNGRMNELGQATRGALSTTGGKSSFLFGSAAFIGAAAGTKVLADATKAASDLHEQITKNQEVFAASSPVILNWSKTTANAIGVSETAALEAAGTFGNLFHTVELAPAKAADLSKSLVQLGADLASFNNTSIEDALQAIQSGLVGQVRPLRRYGVLLSAARVETEALAETGKRNAKQLTDQEKALARVSIIFQDTTKAQGDFQRTQGGVANQARILKANMDDLSAELGTTFLPALQAGIQGLNDFLGAIQKTIHGLHHFREELKGSHFADGFNSAVEGATTSASNFFLKVRDGIPGLRELKGLLGVASTGQGIPPPITRELSQEGHQPSAKFSIVTPQDADKQAKAFVKRFNAHMKGLQLKFDRAQLTKGFADDLAVLNEQLDSIDRAEKRLGKTFELEQQRVSVQGQIKTIDDQISKVDKQSEKIQHVLDGFDLKLSKAELTPKVSDDLKVLNDELVTVRKLIATTKDNADLKSREVDIEQQILDLKKQQTDEVKAQFEAAKSNARSLFGTLFEANDQAKKTVTILGGSKGRQTVLLPGEKGGKIDASGLLGSIKAQNQGFAKLINNIGRLVKEGAPASLIKAAREGQITPEQVAALVNAPENIRKQIFNQVRRSDKLITQAAKAEINTKAVTVHASTVSIRGTVNAGTPNTGHRDNGDIVIHQNIHLDGKKIDQGLERHKKKRTQQTRGRAGGKR